MTGASVIAVTPVAQNLPAIEAAVQQRAVELVAFENPFAVLGSTFGNAFQNISNRGGEISASLMPNLSAILGNPELQRELSVILFRPETVAQQLQDRLAEHQETLRLGWEQSQAGWAAHNELLPGVLERANAELAAGNFTEAFAHINDWFIFGLGAAGWPLYPSLAVPGQVARDVGAPAIAAILDSFLGSDTSIVGIPHAILVPFVSAIFRFTDSLDEIRIAAEAGDVVTTISHTVNLPAKVLGAFLNGYSPSIAEDWNVFPGLLTPGGPIDTFFVQYPTMIANALKALTGQTVTTNTTEALSKVSSAAIASEDDTITLDVETGGGSATPVETVSSSTDATEEEAPAEEAPVAEESTEETAPVVEESTEETAPVSEESGTESDAKGDTTSDEKADSKADAKDDKADAKSDKADAKSDKNDAKADSKSDKADAKADKADKADARADKAAKADAKADKTDKSDAKSSSSSSSSGSSSSGGSSSSE
ncbi:hypothetical protein [Mycolicibacterium bacteremicum]|uniref:hypothetical protein n=1 Tax=Mycolicibacterium bacteremicum TaxID=564198 RepID=UPI0026EFB194|nr:hypothetical protein [Mycolicibacterium bacteremicum]